MSSPAPEAPVQGGGWHRAGAERRQGLLRATVSYQVRADPAGAGVSDYRQLTLSMTRGGTTFTAALPGVVTGRPTLALRDVWDGTAPEALVEAPTGGNLCCDRLRVGVLDDDGKGRVLALDFPAYGWHEQRHGGTVDFVTSDWGFICAFTDCADGSAPIRIFAIDEAGRHFVDVTRGRPDLVTADASKQWTHYLRERGNVGLLAAWCADEYLLAKKSRCDRTLASELAHGSLTGAYEGGGRKFIVDLHASFAKWGYARPDRSDATGPAPVRTPGRSA